MATLKKYRAAYSFESVQLNNAENTNSKNCISFKDTDGDEYTSLYMSTSSSYSTDKRPYQFSLAILQPIATADTQENYSISDYQATPAGTTTYTVTPHDASGDSKIHTFNVLITNSGESDITVNCIKFVKKFAKTYNADKKALCYGYFLDTPLTVAAGSSETVVVEFEIKVGD